MLRPKVESRSRDWPRVVVLALVGIAAAGCSDSARFTSSSYDTDRPAPPQNVANSVYTPPVPSRVEAQPLPAVSQPATVSAAPGTYRAQSLGTYRSSNQYSDITGSATAPASSGRWTWNGGSPVTVGYGETIESIARKHGVPVSALMQTNGIRDAGQIRPGQRLVIPRYVASAPQSAATHAPTQAAAGGKVHVVQSGDTLMSIARRNGVALTALARANHIQSTAKLSVGDRLTIPAGGHPVETATPAPVPTPQVVQSRPTPAVKVASAQVQTVHVAKEEPRTTETVVKTAEPSG
ncbi:MAG: LysM peptidoglycan-binding domain-containing protein, partial [Pseudolabrys sp.]